MHQTVLRAPNGLTADEVARVMGYASYHTMMAELTQHGRKFDADRLLPAMDATGSDAPMRFLARQLGGVFLRTPEPAGSGCELAQTLATSAKEYAEFMQESAASIADGIIEAEELARMNKEGHEAVEGILAMLKLARITHDAQHGGKP